MSDARLYLLTPRLREGAGFAATLDAALAAAPVACVRLRLADAEEATARAVAPALREVCGGRDVALTLAGPAALAKALGLDGVHLAGPRPAVAAARRALGPDAIVGAWAGASKHEAMSAAEAGADYVAIGPVGGEGALAPDELFAWWDEAIVTPSVAEGGLDLAAAARLAPLADYLAVDAAVWDHPEGPAAGMRALASLLGG